MLRKKRRRGVGWVCHSDPKIWASSPFAIPATAATTVIEIEKGREEQKKKNKKRKKVILA